MELEVARNRPRPPMASTAGVLANADLLREIICRIPDPATLIRAALVSKTWYGAASDPGIVQKFLQQQPKRLLGYFTLLEDSDREFVELKEHPEHAGSARFLPACFPESLSHHVGMWEGNPELASVARFLSASFPQGLSLVHDCQNNLVLLDIDRSFMTCDPLQQKVYRLPPLLPLPYLMEHQAGEYFLLSEDGLSAVHVVASWMADGSSVGMEVGLLKGDKWDYGSNSINVQESNYRHPFCEPALWTNGCVYILTIEGYLVGFKMEDCDMFVIDLPTQAWHQWGSHQLCKAVGAEFSYVHADGCKLLIWLRREGAWVCTNSIDLPYLFDRATLNWTKVVWDPSLSVWDDTVTIFGIGHDAMFIFLGVNGNDGLYMLDVGGSKVLKAGEKSTEETGEMIKNGIIPVLLSWAPMFPKMSQQNIVVKKIETAITDGNKVLTNQLNMPLGEEAIKTFIKARYPSVSDLNWSMDDCLTLLYSVAALPIAESGQVERHRIEKCRNLTHQWEQYIAETSSLTRNHVNERHVFSG